MQKFKELGLSDDIIKALKEKGFEEPTKIQIETIPLLLGEEKVDLIGQAQTGTGKTAAFSLPIIQNLDENMYETQALILTPTRELAIQIADEIYSYKGSKKLNVVPIYGGQSIGSQIRRIKKGVDIVVGTPGRIIDHIGRGTLKFKNLSYFVLDEADEMLNMGFVDDVKEILTHTNNNKKMLFFSATIPTKILELAKTYMENYKIIKIKKDSLANAAVNQIYYEINEKDKFEALCRVIDITEDFYGLVFCNTRVQTSDVANKLNERGYDAAAIHGDINQDQRSKIMNKFKQKNTNILVATDVAARGIDVDNLTHVVNYALPQDPESYVHRIGRTGRAGKEGIAVTLVTPYEYRKIRFIERIAKTDIEKGKIPAVSDIVSSKVKKIKDDILFINEEGKYSEYLSLAEEFLANDDPQNILASVIKYAFERDLSVKHYAEISEVHGRGRDQGRGGRDRNGVMRLFIARGREDKIGPKELIEFITDGTGMNGNDIMDVSVLDKFSFVSVPEASADLVMDVFKHKFGSGSIKEARPKAGGGRKGGKRGGSGSGRSNYRKSSSGSKRR